MTLSPSNPRAKPRWLALIISVALLSTFVGSAVLAVHVGPGAFELDRNATSDPAAAGEDWDVVRAGTDTADAATFVVDGRGPTIFTGGGSKDDLNTTGWKHKNGSTPDKDELLNAYAARYGDNLYFGADRYSNSGDAVMGVWFFQNDVGALPGGSFGPDQHEDGDVLVLSDFTGGGGNVTIRVFQWNGAGGSIAGSGAINGTLDLLAGTTASPADCVGPPAVSTGDPFCATVNTANTTSPWPFQAKASGSPANVFPAGHFFEGGIDLASLNMAEECFASFLVETRSSTSVDSVLKDFVGGGFESCDSSVVTTPSDASGNAVTAIEKGGTIYDSALIAGTGSSNAPTGTMTFYICSSSELDAAGTLPSGDPDDPTTCDIGGTLVSTNNVGPHPTIAGNAVARSDAFTPTLTGTWCWRGEYSGDGNYPAATDSSTGECFNVVDARISVTPLVATNESGSLHTVTATVQQDTGSGFTNVQGALVTFSLLNNNAGAAFSPAGANTCTTSAAGTCSIQITTSATGTVDIRATTTITVGGLTGVSRTTGSTGNSVDANKRFVNAQIDLSPLTDTNSIGENHVITATVQQDDGLAASTGGGDLVTGYGPAPNGTTVTFSFQQNTIGATFVGGNTCQTTAGTCSITITSSTAGTVLVRATTTFNIGPAPVEEVTRTTGSGGLNSTDAEKIFVAGSLTWLKHDNAGRLLGGATFSVCRTHTLDSSTDPDTMVDITPDVCVSVVDNAAPDQDADAGEFRLTNLVLGRYTVTETAAPAGYEAAGGTQTKDLTIAAPNGALTIAFVNNRPIVKITGFGYTNSADANPTAGILSGTTVYTIKLQNYGGATATLSNSSLAVTTNSATGTLVCTPTVPHSLNGTTITAATSATDVVVSCKYTGLTDGSTITATLNVNYTTAGTLERAASGSPASIVLTVQGD